VGLRRSRGRKDFNNDRSKAPQRPRSAPRMKKKTGESLRQRAPAGFLRQVLPAQADPATQWHFPRQAWAGSTALARAAGPTPGVQGSAHPPKPLQPEAMLFGLAGGVGLRGPARSTTRRGISRPSISRRPAPVGTTHVRLGFGGVTGNGSASQPILRENQRRQGGRSCTLAGRPFKEGPCVGLDRRLQRDHRLRYQGRSLLSSAKLDRRPETACRWPPWRQRGGRHQEAEETGSCRCPPSASPQEPRASSCAPDCANLPGRPWWDKSRRACRGSSRWRPFTSGPRGCTAPRTSNPGEQDLQAGPPTLWSGADNRSTITSSNHGTGGGLCRPLVCRFFLSEAAEALGDARLDRPGRALRGTGPGVERPLGQRGPCRTAVPLLAQAKQAFDPEGRSLPPSGGPGLASAKCKLVRARRDRAIAKQGRRAVFRLPDEEVAALTRRFAGPRLRACTKGRMAGPRRRWGEVVA